MKPRAAVLTAGAFLLIALPLTAQFFLGPIDVPAFDTDQEPVGHLDPTATAIGDFDGDGIADMALINATASDSDPSLVIYLGKNEWLYPSFAYSSIGAGSVERTSGIVAANFDSDSKLDLAISVDGGYFGVLILKGNGDGSFQTPGIPTAFPEDVGTSFPGLVVARLLDSDSHPDLIVEMFNGATYEFVVLLGLGSDLFSAYTEYGTGNLHGSSGDSWTVADFSGDGKLDIVFGAGDDNGGFGDGILLFQGKGNGTFHSPLVMLTDAQLIGAGILKRFLNAATAADVDGDGKNDFVFATEQQLWWSKAPNNSTLGTPQLIGTFSNGTGFPRFVRAVDFDLNGRRDFATAGGVFFHRPNGTWRGLGVGFGDITEMLVARDLDGDGRAELVTTGVDREHLAIWFNFDPLLVDGYEAANLGAWDGGKYP